MLKNSSCIMTNINGIPVIDFREYGSIKQQILSEKIVKTLKTVGFMYIINHGVPMELIEKVKENSVTYFRLSKEEKMRTSRKDDWKPSTGYNAIGREKLNPWAKDEIWEAFDLLLDELPTVVIQETEALLYSLFPVYESCRDLTNKLLRCIAQGMHLPDEETFIRCHVNMGKCEKNSTLLRTLWYPPVISASGEDRLGVHTDFGTITLLFQDDVGGLEVETVQDVFVPATPLDGAVLVNIGDLLQLWTSNELRATKHRVRANDDATAGKTRQSVVFFVDPDYDAPIEPLEGKKRFPPEFAKERLLTRYKGAYG